MISPEDRAQLDALRWYHTIDVEPGVTTKGWFDLRHALPLIPWPQIEGKRCLDIGTWDGFYAYELERRGASEVIALDVPDLSQIDYPPEVIASADADLTQATSQPRSAAFHLLNKVRGSSVTWRAGNVYDLDPDEIGTFDVVVLGSLLVHLRDPVRALDAVRRVTKGTFVCIDYIHPILNLFARKRPLFQLAGSGMDFQWWLASDAGIRRLLHIGGFSVDAMSKRFLLRPGPAGAPPKWSARGSVTTAANWVQSGDRQRGGHLHRAYVSRPRF